MQIQTFQPAGQEITAEPSAFDGRGVFLCLPHGSRDVHLDHRATRALRDELNRILEEPVQPTAELVAGPAPDAVLTIGGVEVSIRRLAEDPS